MRRIDAAKDAIDDAINGVDPKNITERTTKMRLERARELIEHIELHHTAPLKYDLEEFRRRRREGKARHAR